MYPQLGLFVPLFGSQVTSLCFVDYKWADVQQRQRPADTNRPLVSLIPAHMIASSSLGTNWYKTQLITKHSRSTNHVSYSRWCMIVHRPAPSRAARTRVPS